MGGDRHLAGRNEADAQSVSGTNATRAWQRLAIVLTKVDAIRSDVKGGGSALVTSTT